MWITSVRVGTSTSYRKRLVALVLGLFLELNRVELTTD